MISFWLLLYCQLEDRQDIRPVNVHASVHIVSKCLLFSTGQTWSDSTKMGLLGRKNKYMYLVA